MPKVRVGALAPIAGVTTLLGVAALGSLYGLPWAVLGLAAAALTLVVALLWSSVSSLADDSELSLDEALSYGAPSAEEEQKLAVLRALKDLEFERSVGKISEEDYQEFSARYRAEAKRLIARVDESLAETRKLAEELAEARIQAALAASPDEAEATKEPAPENEPSSDDGVDGAASPEAETREGELRCKDCETWNDSDARFCKHCGKTLQEPSVAKTGSGEEKIA
ncbi:MAG: hypothetical protein ACOY0T_32590 [Myxococcota bacterium]